MKCEVCLSLLEEYFDGELAELDASEVGAHLITCARCASQFAVLTSEQELFAQYDRQIEVPASLWNTIAERTAPEVETVAPDLRHGWYDVVADLFSMRSLTFAGVVAVLLLAILVGAVHMLTRRPSTQMTAAGSDARKQIESPDTARDKLQIKEHASAAKEPKQVATKSQPGARSRLLRKPAPIDHSDVLSSDLGYQDMDDRDTAKHIEQTQNLLRSIRNFPVSDTDDEIDVTYDKALSRRLLNENIVLRRDAEMKAKFPTKTLLADLEPFLIDIANLPDHAKPDEVRVIKERVQKTEIVAALLDYQDRGTNNR